MLVKEAIQLTGGLSSPTKMPGYAYNLPAEACVTGQKLHKKKGSVCEHCYARKHRYRWNSVKAAMYRRLDSLRGDDWADAMAFLINRRKDQGHTFFRWHDSGDLHGVWHLNKIMEVCESTPDVQHWLPTKEYRIVRGEQFTLPSNLTVRISAYYIDKMPETKKIIGDHLPISTVHTSEEVFPDAFSCPAKYQDGKCGDCRACWEADVHQVSYPEH